MKPKTKTVAVDSDLYTLNKNQLIEEIKKLRAAIRRHRDCSGHNLCWYHPELWDLLPERSEIKPEVPPWDEFLDRCVKYRKSL